MIYLLITIGGIMLIIIGFYLMTFGFGIPPNLGLFLLGLCLSVAGMLLTFLFISSVDISSLKAMRSFKTGTRSRRAPVKRTIKPVRRVPKKEYRRKKALEKVKEVVEGEDSGKVKEEAPVKEGEVVEEKPLEAEAPVKEKKSFGRLLKFLESPFKSKGESKEKIKVARKPIIPRKVASREPVSSPKSRKRDAAYVKDRLNKLKKNYIQNVDDIEGLIEDRLDSLKGTLDRIRTQPRMIWSFDTTDVHDAMREILNGARESIVMMHPWIRNIDVSILKKFTDTNSKLIIQEANLDDDASVELIKILLDNNVDIRTMPHIHTIAAVADSKEGLIISTDPIYDSFEVGVIYKEKKSVNEIEKLFKEAWRLSDEISLEGG